MCVCAGTHDILHPYDSDGMAAQLFFTADAPTSRFFRSWDLDLVFDVLQVMLGGPAVYVYFVGGQVGFR